MLPAQKEHRSVGPSQLAGEVNRLVMLRLKDILASTKPWAHDLLVCTFADIRDAV